MPAIITKFLPATDTRGPRIKAECDWWDGKPRTYGYDYALSNSGNHAEAARKLAREIPGTQDNTILGAVTDTGWVWILEGDGFGAFRYPVREDEPKQPAHRSLSEIAGEIRSSWTNMSPHAQPYWRAMQELNSIADTYMHESAEEIIRRFIVNAQGWRGPVAKRIKAELNELVSSK